MTGEGGSQYHIVFNDDFNALNLRSTSNLGGTWNTSFWDDESFLARNGEQEFYVSPNAGLPVNPFSLEGGILTISAQPSPAGWGAQLEQQPYTSGLLTTDGTFAQTYGYFEMRAQVPDGKGLWPAFWLLPSDHSWPPEIDIAEVDGQQPDVLHTVLHSSAVHASAATTVPDTGAGYHTYGLDWEPATISFFFDGQQVFQTATPADMHKPMYMLIDLAIIAPPNGPDSSTPFPAQMNVDYVRAFASPNTIAWAPPITGMAGQGTTVTLSGDANQYTITPAGDGINFTASNGTITDHLSNITALQFSDGTDIVASQTPPAAGAVSSAQVTELYGAVFGRTPDVAGLSFYQNYAAANPTTPFTQFAQWFLASPEYTGNAAHNYAQSAAGDAQFIIDSYNNLLHRDPASGDVAWYQANVINPMLVGLTPGTAAYAQAETQAHALMLDYFSQSNSAEFLNDVTITAQHPSDAQHWLVLI
jgi:beta-glucanase (GH16 family)